MNKSDKLNINFAVKHNFYKLEEADKGNRIIKAIANTYNYFDSDYDVLRMNCAKKSIQERGANSQAPNKILHAKDHNLTQLPGKSIVEQETVINGYEVLYCESRLSETLDGEELLIKYLDGIYNQHSIGFRYINLEYIEKGDNNWDKFISTIVNPEDADKVGYGWDVKEIALYEWSTVAFGANKLTQYLGIKTENKALQLQNIYTKLNALINKAKHLDVKDKGLFELQHKQLKQMIYELNYQTAKASGKPTAKADNNLIESERNILLNLI